MQQAYRALRVVAESQTIRVVLSPDPGELMLSELRTFCAALTSESSAGIKAVVLDFTPDASVQSAEATGHPRASSEMAGPTKAKRVQVSEATGHPQGVPLPTTGQSRPGDGEDASALATSRIEQTSAAIHGVAQPVMAVVRGRLSATASALLRNADLTLAANEAVLIVQVTETEDDSLTGAQAARLGYVTWSAPTNEVSKEMERILDMLRGSSAVALRYTKASVRLATTAAKTEAPKTPLEALQQVNELYLEKLMQTADAHEGLQAFLEKRKPNWKNM